jgi:hypothetical protein
MKKSFTLIEILISVFLFVLLISTLYVGIDKLREFSSRISSELQISNEIKDIENKIFLDVINTSSADTRIITIKEKSLLSLNTSNTYHNPFANNVLYILSEKNNLLRLECTNPFPLYFDSSFDIKSYLKECSIDVFIKDIDIFNVQKNGNHISLFIKLNNHDILNLGINQVY